jgi:hypothetical protein
MRQVSSLLLVGDSVDASHGHRPLISACQTSHYRRCGWNPANRPEPTDPRYLVHDDDGWLTLNWVDGPKHLYDWGGVETWRRAFGFLDRMAAKNTATLIHCDQGRSRAPTLALAYMVREGHLPAVPADAFTEFTRLYPDYQPGGIWDWLTDNWDTVVR